MSDFRILKNISLKRMNTFGVDVYAKNYIPVKNEKDFYLLHKNINSVIKPIFILGSGSNVLFNGDYQGTIIKIECKGIKIIEEDKNSIIIEVKAGEKWDDFVAYALKNNLFGLENLSLIPGTVGASPVQNIGAFGVEVKDFIKCILIFDIAQGVFLEISNSECKFGYRTSRFKKDWYGKYIIYSVKFRLLKTPKVNISYSALKHELETSGISEPAPIEVREAVIKIRKSKLPDPDELGNAGSFFKNPVISLSLLKKIKKEHPDIVFFPCDDINVKLAAGWLIERAGWKGKRQGKAGVHEKQALVIVNHGNATAREIIELSKQIISSVKSKFGVILETEVRIV